MHSTDNGDQSGELENSRRALRALNGLMRPPAKFMYLIFIAGAICGLYLRGIGVSHWEAFLFGGLSGLGVGALAEVVYLRIKLKAALELARVEHDR